MMKKSSIWTLLVLLVAVAALAMPLRATETPTITAPVAQNSPPTVSPAEPSKDPIKVELPEGDLFTPKPNYVCLTGWCSRDAQCEQWYGPGSTCHKQQGATCGHCT